MDLPKRELWITLGHPREHGWKRTFHIVGTTKKCFVMIG
jgi:hypothetical protein